MNKKMTTKYALTLMAVASTLFTACDLDDDDSVSLRPTALVTVKPTADSFILQLDDSTQLLPSNMTKSPFGDKEVRALVNYKIEEKKSDRQSVYINWIDSIRTKMAVPTLGVNRDSLTYGCDPVEVMNDWVTVAEDGYLTLRLRAYWGYGNATHYFNLLTGVNRENPYEVELHHDAKGDQPARIGEAMVAFNLRELLKDAETDKVKITLRWKSFSGMKKTEFELKTNPME